MEATASDPDVQQQFGMIVGIPNAGQLNALGTLNIRGERSVTCRGDFDRHPSLGPAAARRAAGLRVLPPAARRAGARRRARRGITARNPDLDKMPMYGVVFSFKDPFDTKDMRSTGGGDARLRHRLSGARPRAGRAAAQQGRDHLRQGGEHRIQRPRRRSGRPPQARQGAAVDARLSAQHLGRQSVQPLRHHALGLARLELGLGRVGQRQSGDGEPRRGDARLVPRPVQPQRRRADPAAQGDARLRRRRDRRRHLLRPHRHPSRARSATAPRCSTR